jgi:cysteine desulfuration protein SufE
MNFNEMENLLNSVADPVMKLELVMDFGKNLQPVPENAICTEIVGCSSFVEICRAGDNFYGRADSAIVRGIVAIFIAMVDGKNASEIHEMDLLGMFNSLKLNLGAGRLNGVNSMIRFFQNL